MVGRQTGPVGSSVIEHLVLEGTFKGHLVQPLCNRQEHLQLDQFAQSPIQLDLEYFQGWHIYNPSGQPVPMFCYPPCKEVY